MYVCIHAFTILGIMLFLCVSFQIEMLNLCANVVPTTGVRAMHVILAW